MKQLSIRSRLTAWYVAILLSSLSLFGIVAFVAMRKGIKKSVDEILEGQAGEVAEVMGRVLKQEPSELEDELREQQELREQADFLQVEMAALQGAFRFVWHAIWQISPIPSSKETT